MAFNNFFYGRGVLGKDPELKYSAAGKPYLSFSFAAPRTAKQKDGKSVSDWIDCICFGSVAEEIGLQGQKGSIVAVFGSLQNNNWVDKMGQKRKSQQVLVDQGYVLKNYKAEEGGIYANVSLPKNPQTPASNTGGYVDELDPTITAEDFPFF